MYFCKLILGLVTCSCLMVLSNSPSMSDDRVTSTLAHVSTGHPRLFLHDADLDKLKEKINSDLLLSKTFSFIQQVSDTIIEQTPVVYNKVGRRLLGVSRECLRCVNYLAFTYRLTQDQHYLEAAQREMCAAADFPDWNPSHFLDVAEMTTALAIGYDWLYDSLSQESREKIRTAIIEKGLQTSLTEGFWVTATHNWNQVCHGGLVLGALAVLEDTLELATRIIDRAVTNIPYAMDEYAPDGAYPEGPSYWGYGTTYNVLLLTALESVLGTNFDLVRSEGFLKSAEYVVHATGPTERVFNYSDCGERVGVLPALYWFSARIKDPSLLWYANDTLEKSLAHKNESGDRFLPFLLIWADEIQNITPPATLNWAGRGRTPVAFHRTGWDKDATYVAVKAGSPGSNHGHMDIGTFVLEALGVRWAIDFGAQNYHQLESLGIDLWNMAQESQRWTIFRLNNWSHNTLVVDDMLQRVDGRGEIVAFCADAPMPHTIIDISSVYEGQLETAERGIALLQDGSVLVKDEIKSPDHETKVRWGMATRARVKVTRPGIAILEQDEKQLALRVLYPEDAQLQIYKTEKPAREYDAPNKGSCMIGFEAILAPNVNTRLVVYLHPGVFSGELPNYTPLDEWAQD